MLFAARQCGHGCDAGLAGLPVPASELRRGVSSVVTASAIAAASTEEPQNIVLIGGPGARKTHVATTLGMQAIEHHRRKVRFFSTIELVNALEQEKTKGKAGQLAETLVRLDLVILAELGYVPYRPEAARCSSIC